jgi:hypothetical protein
MNARPLTDAQISKALRAHLPEAAAAGLRERVFDAAETTAQLRPFPSFLGALSDADPVGRRRSLLIAAALLVALAVASATAVGAWRLLQRDPITELSLEPPADVPAFVLSSYERLPQLPPVALTWRDSDSAKGRIYVDRSGAVRFDRFTSAEAAEPASYRILSPDHRISGVATVDSAAVWVEPGHEAIGEDPRVHIRGVFSGGDWPGCEMERDPSAVGSASPAAGWRYVGLEYVAGRPTHHIACIGELWIDIETRLILRTQGPAVDDAGQPIPVEFAEVTEISFGEQPAAVFEPPEGLARMSADAYGDYICARDLPNELMPGVSDCPTAEAEATPQPEPSPTPDVRPGPSDCAVLPRDSSQPIGPLAWTPESPKRDWPAPVRPEPAGGGSVQPMPLTYLDPSGDAGSGFFPCVDIRGVMADTMSAESHWSEVHLKLDSGQPVVDPAEQWIAYGVVTDEDRDGVPDWRYGIDNNVPTQAYKPPGAPTRVWRTNLHTGRTDDKGFQPEGYAGPWPYDSHSQFRFGGTSDVAGGGTSTWGIELDTPFYTWASVIVNGRVVATDFAPDAGWLVATPGAKPGGTYLLEDDQRLPHLSMTLPDGWTGNGSAVTDDDGKAIEFMIIGQPPRCVDASGKAIKAHIGPSVDDLVTFAAGQQVTKISENTDVTLDGYRGRYLEYTNTFPQYDDGVNCDDGPGWPLINEFNQVWILDVDGVRLVIDASSPRGASESVRAELRQIVESIHFER